MRLEYIPVVVEVQTEKLESEDDYRKRSGSGGSAGISESEYEGGCNGSLLLCTSANTCDSRGDAVSDKFSETQGQSPSQQNCDYAEAIVSVIPTGSHPEQGDFLCFPPSPAFAAYGMGSDNDAETATATALANDLILEEICRHLPVPDLKNIRLVSTLFKEKATSLLLKKDALEVSLWYSVARNSYTRFKRGENSTELEDLNRLIQSSNKGKFPCSAVRFGYALTFSLDMITFFSRYGSALKSVSLALDEPVKNKVLRELLLSKAPNLKRLEFRQFDSYEERALVGDDNELFPGNSEHKPVILPHLTHLYVDLIPSERVKKMVLSLMKAAVNLQSFEGYKLEYSDIVKDVGKEDVVTEFGYYPTVANLTFVKVFSGISPYKFPRLTRITFDLFESRKRKDGMKSAAGNALVSIMEANKTTLKKISMGPIGHYPEIQLPVLANVSELRLLPWGFRQFFPMFSPGFNIGATFPCLQTCDLTHLSLCNDSLAADYFPGEDFKLRPGTTELSTNTFSTVKCLKINNAMSDSDLVFMSYKFPNVTRVQLYCAISVVIENRIWTLPEKVESIEFHGFDVSTLASRHYFLDTFFTGIPFVVVENLSKALDPGSRLKTEFPKHQRCQSMNSLKSLKNVRVFFHQTFELFGSSPYIDEQQYPSRCCSPFITHVTRHFVFSEMPSEFKMHFSYDHGTQWAPYLKKILQPVLSDSITISHHDERYGHVSWSS